MLGADEKQLGVSERLTAGAMAGVASQTSIYPLEVKVLYLNKQKNNKRNYGIPQIDFKSRHAEMPYFV